MPSILESLSSVITPDVVSQLSKAIGADPAAVNKGLGAVGATTLASLANTASTSEGAASLVNMLPKDTGGDFLGNLMSSVTGGAGGTQADLVNNLLGSGANAIGGTLSQSLGFNVRPLLGMAVPMVAGMITKLMKDQNLDAAGVAKQLTGERDAFLSDPANQETAGFVSSALDAGKKAEALRGSFSDGEWMKVRMAPIAAVYLVATASPSGGGGEAQELAAAAGAVGEAVQVVEPTSLVGAAFGGGLTKAELDQLKKDAPPKAQILGVIRDGLALVKQKSPRDAQAYQDLILNVAQRSAEAAKEGGFLGFGGTQVSKEEQQAVSEIRAALA